MENKMEREAAPRKSRGTISRQQIVPATGRSKAAVIEPRECRGSERMLHGELDFRISDGLSGVLSTLVLPQCSTSICITSLVWWDTQHLDCLHVSWGWDPPTSLGSTATSLPSPELLPAQIHRDFSPKTPAGSISVKMQCLRRLQGLSGGGRRLLLLISPRI